MIAAHPEDFQQWRSLARGLIAQGVHPEEVMWGSPEEELLFDEQAPGEAKVANFSVPRDFLTLATRASLHRDPSRWSLLYRILWRLLTESKSLLRQSTDPDVLKLKDLDGEVRRDCHKMKAFVRFRKTPDDRYVAWHEPSHLVVKAVAPFFARRFNNMDWAILTPDTCAYWDRSKLLFGPGLTRAHAPQSDELEELWKTYYANIFNPARVKISAMVSEMPKKYWHTMPETAIIAQLLEDAPRREREMIEAARSEKATPYHIAQGILGRNGGLGELRQAAKNCQGCDLCHTATQTVFGQGPKDARVVLIGEQPGDQEDHRGEPFVGPAGQLLRRCLKRVGVSPESVYLTNVVKHFRWEPSPRGGRNRLHKRATWRQIDTCEPWVRAELEMLRPDVVILLGATALQSLVGRELQIGQHRGIPLPSDLAPRVVATVHPSSLLRMRDNRQQQLEIGRFCQELSFAFEMTQGPLHSSAGRSKR